MNLSSMSTTIKIVVTSAIALALLVPVAMIRDLISERQARRNEAVGGIALGWGQRQALAGPFLSIPYERTWVETTQETVEGRSKERRLERSEWRVQRIPVEPRLTLRIGAAAADRAPPPPRAVSRHAALLHRIADSRRLSDGLLATAACLVVFAFSCLYERSASASQAPPGDQSPGV